MFKSIDEGTPGDFGDVCYRKERRKRQKLIIFELSREYAKNTTLHGLRYVTEKLTVVEKLYWMYIFIACAVTCTFLIRNNWVKWITSPVIVTLNEHLVPVGDVPFPSVTICPQNKNRKSVYNFYENYQKFAPLLMQESTETQNPILEKFEDIGLICHGGLYNKYLNKILGKISKREISNASVVKHILEVAPDVSNVFESCIFRERRMRCSNMFKKVLTGEGVCFNFNSLNVQEIFRTEKIQREYQYLDRDRDTPSKQWSLEEGYSKESYTSLTFKTYPFRGKDNGAKPDFQIILKEEESDQMCNSMNKGFKIYIQHPADMPQNSLYYYAALPNKTTSMAIKVKMLNTSPSLKGYTPEVRQCYFQIDKQLQYFRPYTASNCRLECQSRYTYNECKCVSFNMPHHNSSEICTQKQRACLARALDKLANDSMKSDTESCRCLPACDSIQYDADILKIDLDVETELSKINKKRRKLTNTTGYSFSKLEMYFKEHAFVSTRRSELFGYTEFLANCGGLLGLFHGFSFLSLVEIVYFVTLRLYFTLKKDLKKEKVQRKLSKKN